MPTHSHIIIMLALSFFWLTSCASHDTVSSSSTISPPMTHLSKIDVSTPSVDASSVDPYWQGNSTVIWDRLQQNSLLKTLFAQTHDKEQLAWIRLAIISKQRDYATKNLVAQLLTWRKDFPDHPGNALFPNNEDLLNMQGAPPIRHIALLLPLQGPLATQGQTVRDGFLSAYYESLAAKDPQQTISFYDTSHAPDVAALYQQALAEGADMVIGPLAKENVQQLVKHGSYPVPTVALNYTETALSSLPHNFYQFGLSPKDEAEQAAARAWHAGASRALIIAPEDRSSERLIKPLLDKWNVLGGKVVGGYYFHSGSNLSLGIANLLHVNPKEDRAQMREDNDKTLLGQQRRQDFDVIFLLSKPEIGRAIVPLLKYYYVDNVPIYSTAMIYSGVPSPVKDADLNGVIFCDIPWILNKTSSTKTNRLYAVGRDAQLLSRELPRLLQLPNFPIYAATGALTLGPDSKIYRRLPWTKMHDGRA